MCVCVSVDCFDDIDMYELVGRVVQVGFDHIGLVVHGIFNASIPASNIRAEFTRDSTQDRFQCASAGGQSIELGSFVWFIVDSYVENARTA